MKLSGRILGTGAALAATLVSTAALAAGKAGLWSVTTTISMPGMPQMPQMTPEQIAQMQRLGVQMPAMPGMQPFTAQRCITPQSCRATTGCAIGNCGPASAECTTNS